MKFKEFKLPQINIVRSKQWKLPKLKTINIVALVVIGLFIIAACFLIFFIPVSFKGTPQAIVTLSKNDGKNNKIRTCTTPCSMFLSLGKYNFHMTKEGMATESEILNVSILNRIFAYDMIAVPEFFMEKMITSTEITDYGWIGETPVYRNGEFLFRIGDGNLMVFALPNNNGIVIWDEENQLKGFLSDQTFHRYKGDSTLIPIALDFSPTLYAASADTLVISDTKKLISLNTVSKQKIIETTVSEAQKINKISFLSQDNLLIQVGENEKSFIFKITADGNKEEIFSYDRPIDNMTISPNKRNLSFTRDNLLIVTNLSDQTKHSIELTSENILGRQFVWKDDSNIFYIEKYQLPTRILDHIFTINPFEESKVFVDGSFAITNRLDFGIPFRISRSEKRMITRENDGVIWMMSLSNDIIQRQIIFSRQMSN